MVLHAELPCYGIVLELGARDPDRPGAYQGGRVVRGLEREQGAVDFNAAMDAVEALILAHAVAGVDVASPAYVEGIETAVEACGNHLEGADEDSQQEIARLVGQAQTQGIRSEEIDELVHDVAASQASAINNGGLKDDAGSPTTEGPAPEMYELRIDCPLLRKQRELLLRLRDAITNPEDSDAFEGLVELSDQIADQAHDQHGIDCLFDSPAVTDATALQHLAAEACSRRGIFSSRRPGFARVGPLPFHHPQEASDP